MKKLSLFLALLLMLSSFGAVLAEEAEAPAGGPPGQAAMTEEEAAAAAEQEALLKQDCEFSLIEADGEQPRLTYIEGVTTILEVDGYYFKDLNKNGELDVYEDWRQETDARVADLISQMTVEEEVGLLFCVNTQLADAADMVREFNLTCQLFNLNGTPIEVTNTLNNLQAVAEAERLGVPMVFTSDREYNAWGGYIDKSHEAFGTANDPELAAELAAYYAQAMTAVGVHVTFEPYANEIGAQYGENPEHIAKIISAEVSALQENGLSSCTKHWIGRGGDSSFGAARSVAQNFDNWMVGWKAAIDAGAEWVMTNCGGTGITNTVDVKWDEATMSYLRDTLGFDGVVVTDWWALGGGPSNPGRMSGVTAEGVDLGTKDIRWLYNEALRLGTDMFGSGRMVRGEDWEDAPSSNYPDAIINGLNEGDVDKANVDRAATRILTHKFNKGLFEDPYNVIDEMLEVCASDEWIANPTEITTNEELRAARNPEEVELTERLMAESAVLVKNDDNLLPLEKGIKVYVDASSGTNKEGYIQYISEYATVVETMEEADVVIGDYGEINDAAELFIEDAKYYEKPMVLTLNNTDPDQYTLESADALLYLSYNQSADHGSTEAGFINTTAPWIYADLLFGEREPSGIIVKEIARDEISDAEQWKDLAGDQGASPYVRLMIQATMEDDPNHASPSNWGDPLVTYNFGMRYGEDPDFEYSCLILPTQLVEEEYINMGSTSTRMTSVNSATAGETFTLYALLRNNGADGITTAQVYVDGELAAEKIMTVEGGSWRVVQMDLTLEAGEHTITLGDQEQTITVA